MSVSTNRVSVVIPLYNHARFIPHAVASVRDQGDIVRELIVIDDGSKDHSAAVMQDLARSDRRISFVTQTNQGAHAAINRGLSAATGEYLTILNSDDAFQQGRLAALTRALDLDEGSAIACSSIAFMDGEGCDIENPWFKTALDYYKSVRDLGLALVNANFVMTTSNIFMRRSLFERLGGFAPLRYAHDMEFLLRCAANGVRLAFIDHDLLRYRFHASNTISENHDQVRFEWALCAAFFMHLVWQRAGSKNWVRAQAVQDVLQRHGLQRAVSLCLLRLAQSGAQSLEESGIVDDDSFRATILDILRCGS